MNFFKIQSYSELLEIQKLVRKNKRGLDKKCQIED